MKTSKQQPKRLQFTSQLKMLMFLACLKQSESKKFTEVGKNEIEYFEQDMTKSLLDFINGSIQRFDYIIK